ncbi:MAG TPA: hypothetical protein VHM30_14035, partial [Gemmatimonadaceae bacterium]|nr:hypothetical protein [Gemmatimonadaceae bacterium]
GTGVEQNYEEASWIYRDVCDNGHNGEACARLANLHEKGAGVWHDLDQAKRYRKRACDFGYADACPPAPPRAPARSAG